MRWLLLACLAACTDPAPDFGAPSDVYPDRAVAAPAITNPSASPVMPSVRVVPVFFAGDEFEADVTRFLSDYAASPYWAQQVGEYGVGALTVADAVELPDPAPAQTDRGTFDALVTSLAGPADATTVFVVFYPQGTTFLVDDEPYVVGGFHSYAMRGNDAVILAAVFEGPSRDGQIAAADFTTFALSHELVEAATDPLVPNGYFVPNAAAVPFTAIGGDGELGDACRRVVPPLTPPGFAHPLARTWSNAAASQFHDPCVPSDGGPYFAAVPEQDDTAAVEVGTAFYQASDTRIPIGTSATIAIDLLSSAPTDDWTIEPFEPEGTEHALEMSLDKATGQNGNRVHLTIKSVARPSTGSTVFGLRSTLGGRITSWFGVIVI